jgi:hypothetical protein
MYVSGGKEKRKRKVEWRVAEAGTVGIYKYIL